MRPRAAAWRTAVSLFTVLPIAGPAHVDRVAAGRALLLLPVVGVLLGGIGAGVHVAVALALDAPAGRVLAAALAVAAVAALTGGLHLDGLADTADGLGSRQPTAQALDIMRKSDIGPFGVVTLVFVVLVQVAAFASVPPGLPAALALPTAVVVARVAVVLATATRGARGDGFGALVAGAVGRRTRYAYAAAVLLLAATPAAFGAPLLAARLAVASAVGLIAAYLLRAYAARRLGGTTGDVYGAVVETTTTTVLLTLAIIG